MSEQASDLPLELLTDGPEDASATLVLAHGAGAAMDSPFMQTIAEQVAAAGIRVLRFEFPYMRRRRATGKRGGPNGQAVLLDSWREAIAAVGRESRLVIGGKSLGGRVASMLADEVEADGLVCLGYPFHPPGRLGSPRIAHLAELRTPALICQGERDPFGRPEEVEAYALSPSIRVHWLPDGDHSFKPRKSSGRSEADNLAEAAAETVAFVEALVTG